MKEGEEVDVEIMGSQKNRGLLSSSIEMMSEGGTGWSVACSDEEVAVLDLDEGLVLHENPAT